MRSSSGLSIWKVILSLLLYESPSRLLGENSRAIRDIQSRVPYGRMRAQRNVYPTPRLVVE